MSSYELIPNKSPEGVLELRMNRPARLNALTHTLAKQLRDQVQAARDDRSVRVLLICAEGRAFCAGKDRDDPPSDEFVQTLQELSQELLEIPKPVVAAVQGWAVGAGFELAAACDLIIAADNARFQLPEIQLGLPATGGIHMLLPRLVGMSRAKGLLWLGQEMDAPQALQWGLAWELTTAQDLSARSQALARQLATLDADSLARIKRLVHAEHLPDIGQALQREAQF